MSATLSETAGRERAEAAWLADFRAGLHGACAELTRETARAEAHKQVEREEDARDVE